MPASPERYVRLAAFREAINHPERRVNLDEVLTEIIDTLLDDAKCDRTAQLDS